MPRTARQRPKQSSGGRASLPRPSRPLNARRSLRAPQAKTFRFDQHYSPEQADAFLLDFFASPAVQAAAPVCVGTGGSWGALGALQPGAVKHARLPTTVLRMDFFQRLDEAGIIRSGDIAKCLDVQVRGRRAGRRAGWRAARRGP